MRLYFHNHLQNILIYNNNYSHVVKSNYMGVFKYFIFYYYSRFKLRTNKICYKKINEFNKENEIYFIIFEYIKISFLIANI